MRYGLIIAGGSGTRLWPMSRASLPKQLIPLFDGQSLLELAFNRLEGLLPIERRLVCAGAAHERTIRDALPMLASKQFFGEPCGRDTMPAVALSAAVLASYDPDATIAVFTADHIIEPVEQFREIVETGFSVVEQNPDILLTFGITPTAASTAYGYLELGDPFGPSARRVQRFREKPDAPTAEIFFAAGPEKFLWNSGMFIWRADVLLDFIGRYSPQSLAALLTITEQWDTDNRRATLQELYPKLAKISVDYAVMEPASQEGAVVTIPMPLRWLDVGSWPSLAKTCPKDENGNSSCGTRTLSLDTHDTLTASSDPEHLIATVGCDDLIIVHTPDATLVCRADRADSLKELHKQVAEKFGEAAV